MIGGKNLPTPQKQKLDFRQKKGGHPKSGKNSTNSDLAETFRISPGLRKNGIGNEKFYAPLSQNLILGKKEGGGAPQIRQKFNQLGFGCNFQDNSRPKKEWDWE